MEDSRASDSPPIARPLFEFTIDNSVQRNIRPRGDRVIRSVVSQFHLHDGLT